MQHIEVTDELLYKYMPIVDEAIIMELENNTDYEYQFSAKFVRKMRMLIWKDAHPWVSDIFRQLKRTVAMSICVAVVLFLLTMSVEGNQIKLFETVRTMWEDSELYTYFYDAQEGEFQEREPAYIPEGYEVTYNDLSDIHLLLIYENDVGEVISWEQMIVSNSAGVVVDNEYDSKVVQEVDGKFVTVCIYADGFKYAYCEHKEYVYILTADNLAVEEIYKMFR